MAIDPDTQAVLNMIRLAGRPPFDALTPAEAREAMLASRKILAPEPEDVAECRDTSVPGPLGPIGLRLYRPSGTQAMPSRWIWCGFRRRRSWLPW